MRALRDGLTVEQSSALVEALPELHKLARGLARRCPHRTVDELAALAEDSLISRIHRWDPTRGRLIDFARKDVRLDVIRSAYSRAHEPAVAASLRAMGTEEEAIEPPDTETRWAESVEDKEARAIALGQNQVLAGLYAYEAARAARSPEDEYGSRERFEVMKHAAAATEPRAAELLDLLYVHDLTWEEASARLDIDMRKAQRIEARAFERLRAMFGPEGRRAP